MSLQALTELAQVEILTPEIIDRLVAARDRQLEYDQRLSREVLARVPSNEALNRAVNWGVRHEP